MSLLFLYQSASGKKMPFRPINKEKICFYACGPTVYDFIHLGNGRTFLFFDILYRTLKFLYPEVLYVRNITDIDDKINAAVEKTEENIQNFTKKRIEWFQEDTKQLGLLSPGIEPLATDFIPGIVSLIEGLINKGYAYVSQGHVLFHVASWPSYGSLSNRRLEDMIEGARIEVAPYKKDPLDFVLWKPSEGQTIGWDSPWGYGRPGWHTECAVMSHYYLGAHFDIHGGGQDLLFPHHENEQAQVCAHEGTSLYANYWVHCGMLVVQGQKMSKSLGNFITLRQGLQGLYGYSLKNSLEKLLLNLQEKQCTTLVSEALKMQKDRQYTSHSDELSQRAEKYRHGHILRWALLSTHYRQELNWTQDLYTVAKNHLYDIYSALAMTKEKNPQEYPELVEALCDDVNTPKVLQILISLGKKCRENPDNYGGYLWFALDLLGFSVEYNREFLQELAYPQGCSVLKHCVSWILTQRSLAKKEKNYKKSDEWRDILHSCGLVLQDREDQCQWFMK